MLCVEDGWVQCVIKHGEKRHLPYVVCVENGRFVHDTLIEHGVDHHLSYAVRIKDGWVQCVKEHGVEHQLPYAVCGR